MKKKMVVGGFIIVILLVIIFKRENINTIEKAMAKANMDYEQILHQVDTDKGVVVFYEPVNDPNCCSIGLIEKKSNNYKWVFGSGNIIFDYDRDMRYMYCNIGRVGGDIEKSFPVEYGVVMNSNIEQVKVALRDEEARDATIVETNLGRIWYLFLDKQICYTPKILGLDSDGEIIFGIGK